MQASDLSGDNYEYKFVGFRIFIFIIADQRLIT